MNATCWSQQDAAKLWGKCFVHSHMSCLKSTEASIRKLLAQQGWVSLSVDWIVMPSKSWLETGVSFPPYMTIAIVEETSSSAMPRVVKAISFFFILLLRSWTSIMSSRSASKFHLNTFQSNVWSDVMFDAITFSKDCVYSSSTPDASLNVCHHGLTWDAHSRYYWLLCGRTWQKKSARSVHAQGTEEACHCHDVERCAQVKTAHSMPCVGLGRVSCPNVRSQGYGNPPEEITSICPPTRK